MGRLSLRRRVARLEEEERPLRRRIGANARGAASARAVTVVVPYRKFITILRPVYLPLTRIGGCHLLALHVDVHGGLDGLAHSGEGVRGERQVVVRIRVVGGERLLLLWLLRLERWKRRGRRYCNLLLVGAAPKALL